jgi:hypothetical protein
MASISIIPSLASPLEVWIGNGAAGPSRHDPRAVTAIRVYERLGFKLVGRLRDVIVMNGTRYDQVIMDLLRHDLTLRHIARFQGLDRA